MLGTFDSASAIQMAGLTHSEAGVYKDYELTLHHSNVFVAIAVGVGVTAMSVLVILGLELFLRDNPQSKMLRFDMLREEHLQTTVRNTQINHANDWPRRVEGHRH